MIRIGDLIFPTQDSGGKLGQLIAPVSTNIYWTYATETVNLTSLNATAGATKTLAVVTNGPYVTLQNVIVTAYFTDSATATYNVSNRVLWTPIDVINGKRSTFSINAYQNLLPLDMIIDCPGSQFQITVAINGGDVLRETGITPGAGDTVSFTINASYY